MGKVKVMITNNQTEVKIPVGIRLLVRRCCHAVLEYEGHNDDFEVSVSFVNDEQIHELNKEHRNIDRSTDVLSFPLGENGDFDMNHAIKFLYIIYVKLLCQWKNIIYLYKNS